MPSALHLLTVRSEGYAPAEEEVEVLSGVDVSGLRVELAATPGLDLMVRLASGIIPPLAHLRLLDASGRVVLEESRPLNESGGARLATVPSGTWELLVGAPGGVARRFATVVPGEALEAILPIAGRLVVRVPDLATSDFLASLQVIAPDGRPLDAIDPGGRPNDRWPIHAGRGMAEGIPAGDWVVEVTAADGRVWTASVTTGAGTVELVLD